MAKKIGLVGIYFPGAYDTLHENVPEGFELVDALSPDCLLYTSPSPRDS